ncbi:MAG: glutamate-5-semialdehyde dehydrogenase [Lachnospiraceae bacterium]|nr:glutamate-5-semialdehyde dehydrogenase [Lachnospiraceae bacterium]MDD5854617.1 glutamate-5-semialdehyde dehydrogenase [Lachnospiraceae bacterium]
MTDLIQLGKAAVAAKYKMQLLDTDTKNKALLQIASALVAGESYILSENAKDIEKGEKNGMHPGMIDRLRLSSDRIKAMAEGLEQVAKLPDPIHEVLSTTTRPNGLVIKKVRVPLGVIGIIYESRPNVTADAFGLCFKSGNAVILKGGSDAIHSNIAITKVIRDALESENLDANAIQLIEDTNRETTQKFMRLDQYVDVLIPRGSAGLIRAVVQNSTIPVIETGSGNCHIYVDKDADFNKAIPIIINAKTQRIGVCNACESLVVHKDIEKEFLPLLEKALKEKQVEIRADKDAGQFIKDYTLATEEDFATEYLDYIISVKTVSSVEEAIEHINAHNTKHSEAIITENKEAAEKFKAGVDAACVYVNASTRFTDGFEFGFGAEIGISTQKLHARGPMGLNELTSYQYQIEGDGQIRP